MRGALVTRMAVVAVAASTVLPAPVLASNDAEPDDPAPATSVVENPFLPEDTTVNLGDCVSVLPRPECGSKARGGWRQLAVLGAIVGGLGIIGTRMFVQMNRRREERDDAPAPNDTESPGAGKSAS